MKRSPTTSISSDDSSSSSDDSEELEARLVPAALRAQTTTITDINSSTNETKSKRTRKRPNKRETSIDSDLSEDDVNTSSAPKTEHEVLQPVIELPKITKLPEDSILTPFGKIMSVIDTVVVIKADTAGDWRVLDEGCICCWEDKTVIGNVNSFLSYPQLNRALLIFSSFCFFSTNRFSKLLDQSFNHFIVSDFQQLLCLIQKFFHSTNQFTTVLN